MRHNALMLPAALCAAALLCGCGKSGADPLYGSGGSAPSGQDGGEASGTTDGEAEDNDDDVCVYMTDPEFRAYCLQRFDADGNGKVSTAEAEAVTEMYDCYLPEDLTGIERFPNLEVLSAHAVRVIDLSGNPRLRELDLQKSPVRSLDLTANTGLEDIMLFGTPVETVDMSRCAAMTCLTYAAFLQCGSLREVLLPESLTEIGADAFHGCGALASVALPEGLESVGREAFRSSGLTEVRLPASVRDIYAGAFFSSSSLSLVTCEAAVPPELDYDQFYGIAEEAVLRVPASSVEAYRASAWAGYFSDIEGIPAPQL